MITSRKQYKNIDEYISMFPPDVQDILQRMRSTIRESAPDAEEAISYRVPTFKLNSKNLAHFAAFANHIAFFPTASGKEAFRKELSQYKGGKGTVQFPLDKPIPFHLVRRIAKFRAKEILNNTKKNSKAR